MMDHLPLLPILIPLLAAAAMLFVEHGRLGMLPQRAIAWTSLAAMLAVSLLLLRQADGGSIGVYLLGDWPARLGIVLVVDRLSALMVLLGQLLAAACLLHACAGRDRRATHFHAFFQFQLMGLNGAFLTGDLFNLFVFFEVLLIASYGLLGTLNMAEMAARVAEVPAGDLALVEAAAGLLLVVFCAKAALLPMYLWLPQTYTQAPAAVAALFAIMTKVGLYAVLRVGTLSFGLAGPLAGFAWPALQGLGAVTLVLAALGVLAARRLRMLAAYLVLGSAATLFVAFALAKPGTIAAGLYYLVHSTLAGAALFLIADLVRQRGRGGAGQDMDTPRMGRMASLLFLLVAVSLAGLPPLSGFIGKLLLLAAVPAGATGWVWTCVLGSSFLMLVGLARTGVQVFWGSDSASPEANDEADEAPPSSPATASLAAAPLENAAILLLVGYGIALALAAAPILAFTRATAEQLLTPADYIHQVDAALPARRAP